MYNVSFCRFYGVLWEFLQVLWSIMGLFAGFMEYNGNFSDFMDYDGTLCRFHGVS